MKGSEMAKPPLDRAPPSDSPSSDEVHRRLLAQRAAIARLMRSEALTRGDLHAALGQVTELAANLLKVERASVWRIAPGGSTLECLDLFEASGRRHTAGNTLDVASAPDYFSAISEARTVAAHDARTDTRTRELAPGYLEPLGVGAMLDAPVIIAGKSVGVVCHEHVGPPRRWDFWEELVAGTLADFVARVMEAADRLRAERELGYYRRHLDAVVSLRTAELRRINAELETKVRLAAAPPAIHGKPGSSPPPALSPVAIVFVRSGDGLISFANDRAAELFDISAPELVDTRADLFHGDDIAAFEAELHLRGRVDNFTAELTARSGRRFWALLSAEATTYEGQGGVMIGLSDITAQKVAELAVRHSADTLRKLFEAAPVPVLLSRVEDGVVLLGNQRLADLMEIPLEELAGKRTLDFYVRPEEREELSKIIVEKGIAENVRMQIRTQTGKEFWVSMSSRLIDFEGTRVFLVGLLDITKDKLQEDRLRELATQDALTGTFNRRHFFETAEREVERARRHRLFLCVCMLDLDHFKQVNDEHGHAVGDAVLRSVARACSKALRQHDVLCRYGGEEFVLLMPHTTIDQAAKAAERLRATIEATTVPLDGKDGTNLRCTASFGVVELALGKESLEEVLRRADRALYQAKQQGRNRVVAE